MAIRKIEIERLGATSCKPFEAVAAALEAAVGHTYGYGRVLGGNQGRTDLLRWKMRFVEICAGRG
jgi:hypothetical protein